MHRPGDAVRGSLGRPCVFRTEAEQFLTALPAPEPEESDVFLAELRSELPREWADRAEVIYRRHLGRLDRVTPFAVSPVGPAAVRLADTCAETENLL
jgi:hypothetical protein